MRAKNALRRSARPARHIDAHSAGCGMLLVTLQASIKTPGGACTAFAYHVMLSSIVLPAKEKTKEYFCTAAWTARKPNRRARLQCQTRTRGFWTCAACHQRRPQLQFSTFLVKRPSGEDGTQICNACHAEIAQKVLRKRAVTATVARLELRKRIRRAEVL